MEKSPGKPTGASHTQRAYEGIKEMLFTNAISPGQKISYRQLAEHLGMSLTPVIQALKHLEFQGLVRYTPNKGYATEPMSMQEVQEIYDTREILEVSLLPDVIARLDEAGIQKLSALVDKESAVHPADGPEDRGMLTERVLRDRSFHLTLARLSGRRVQVQILSQLFDLLYLKYRGTLLFVPGDAPVGALHRDIFSAVISHDTELARKTMQDHFTKIRAQALKRLGQLIAAGDGPTL